MSQSQSQAESAPRSLPRIANKSLLLAGAGISCLSLTLALDRHWKKQSYPSSAFPRITILERDTPESRVLRQGYTMSLRTDGGHGGGVRVLDDLGIYQMCVERATGFGIGDMCLWDGRETSRTRDDGKAGQGVKEDWPVIMRMSHEKASTMKGAREGLRHMRIKRSELVSVLTREVEKVPRVKILWGREVVDVRVGARSGEDRGDAGGVVMVVNGGEEFEMDLLVACDGSKSRVRRALRPDLGLDFAGLCMITATSRWSRKEDVPRPLDRDWGIVMCANEVALFSAPVDEMSVVWSVGWLSNEMVEEKRSPWGQVEAQGVLEQAKRTAEAAGPKIARIIDASDPQSLMVINARDRPPFEHDVEKHGPVIWMGDANHAVSPYAGNGANMALLDGWDLAESLCEATSLQDAVKSFDNKFHPRTQAVLKDSHRNISVGHASGWRFYCYYIVLRVMNLLFG